MEDLKMGHSTSLECCKLVTNDLANMQSSKANLISKIDYLQNQSRCNNFGGFFKFEAEGCPRTVVVKAPQVQK